MGNTDSDSDTNIDTNIDFDVNSGPDIVSEGIINAVMQIIMMIIIYLLPLVATSVLFISIDLLLLINDFDIDAGPISEKNTNATIQYYHNDHDDIYLVSLLRPFPSLQ